MSDNWFDLSDDVPKLKKGKKEYKTSAGQAYQRDKERKMGLGERVRKSPAGQAVRVAKTGIPQIPHKIKGAAQYYATKEQKAQHPKKQIKKLVGGAGHHIAHKDKPFSSIAKSFGFGKRGG